MSLHTETYKGYEISIEQDDMAENPREWQDHLGHMVCWHKRYDLGDKHDYDSPDDFNAEINDNNSIILPLYLYDHSGITMSTSPFSCPWDSGQVGFIYITKEDAEEGWKSLDGWREAARQGLQAEVDEYDKYLRGECYFFTVLTGIGKTQMDSCGGFLGFDYCLESARESVDSYKDLSEMTEDDFDSNLKVILTRKSVADIIDIPGIQEILADVYNNEVIDMWEEAK